MFLCSSVAPVISILKFFKSNTITVRKGAAVDIPAEVKALPLATICWTKDQTVIEKPDVEKMTLETEEVRTQRLGFTFVDHFKHSEGPWVCCIDSSGDEQSV